MSDGFAGSSTRSLEEVEREVETRMKRLELVGVVKGQYGSAEIHKNPAGQYLISNGRKTIGQAKDFKSARSTAQGYVSQKPMDRAMKKLDAMTEDFAPGSTAAADVLPGQDASKRGETQARHTDNLSAAGNAADQDPLDELDGLQQRIEGGIKPPSAQFPGEPASVNSGLDVHQVDPARMGMSEFDQKVERKMKARK